ncbi:hypothetical protein ACTFIZ_010615 [Dictyostelium cf. discoideum]
MKVNQKYSIIKIDQSVIKDYFRNQVLCIFDLTYEKLLQLNKLESEGIEKNGLLDISSNNNNIVELHVYDFLLEKNSEEGFMIYYQRKKKNMAIYKDFQPILYLNTIDLEGSQDDYNEKTFRILKYLKSKNIIFRTNYRKNVHADFSLMFNSKINNQVESIRIDSDFVEPIHLQNVNELSNLHTLSTPLHFHQMILLQLGIEEFHCRSGDLLEHKDNVIQDWDKMIQSLLSTSRQVKKLFSNGIKQLLSSSTFKYFKISNMYDIIDIDTFSELKNNKTLKKLVYKEIFQHCWVLSFVTTEEAAEHQFNIINYLIENVFSNGGSGGGGGGGMLGNNIKHFKFSLEYPYKLNNDSNINFKHYNYFQLYSITIVIYDTLYEEVLNEIINLSNKISKNQKQQQQQSIKEFKIVIAKYLGDIKHFQSILNDRNINGDNGLFILKSITL